MIYNPLDTFYKSKIGAFCENKSITFRVKGNFNSLSLYYFKDGDKERNTLTEFNSNNTELWAVEQVKEKLLSLQYIRDRLNEN